MADVAKDKLSNRLLLNREYSQSSSSISPASSRRDSLRPAHPGSGAEPPAPTSPPYALRRKRATTLSIDAATEPRLEDFALTSASNTSAVSAGEKVCLCQPDPKIPRPRNAFILYRQHYQAQVVALNPGLANPEISKIIGEQWTSQPAEVKNEWKRLAEEEKIRHQLQYPDYRYQPRRAGTTNQTRRISSGEGPIRCPKCNGRYILTSRTPSTPLTPGLSAQYDRLLPPFASQGMPSRNVSIDDGAQFPAVPNNTPRTAPSHPQIRWRPGSLQQNHAPVEINSARERRMSIDMSGSPEFKRRRFNNGSQGHHSPSPYDSPQHRSSRPPVSAAGYLDNRRIQLPPGRLAQNQKGGMMEPPPRPSPAMQQFSNMSPNSPYDESLRLPPLQTQGSHSGLALGRINGHQRADSQARSVEAMVMTIPYINKIKVLSKISPPLAPPGPTSPVQNVRGAVIAVEGSDFKLVAEVGTFIQEYLSKEPECLVKTWPASEENNDKNFINEAEMSGMDEPSGNFSAPNSPYLTYLNTIRTWHSRSIDIVNFITTLPSSQPVAAGPSSNTSSTTTAAPRGPNPPSAPPPPPPPPSSAPPTPTSGPPIALPIALLPHGFSLSLSDTFASHVPITDAYAPVDHWQWMATLWRGIVGPDLTVYVKALDVAADREAREELARFGGVECRWDVGAVVVRACVGVGGDGDADGHGDAGSARGKGAGAMVEEKTLRRLGFEVLEWVRGGMAGGRTAFGKGLGR